MSRDPSQQSGVLGRAVNERSCPHRLPSTSLSADKLHVIANDEEWIRIDKFLLYGLLLSLQYNV
jgi:hypothetical protein